MEQRRITDRRLAVHNSIQNNKITNSNKGTAAHRDTCGTLWASGDAQTHTLTAAELPLPADVHRCRNGIEKKTVTEVLLPIDIHVTLFGLQATHKSTLLLPQSSHHQQTSTGATMVLKNPTVTKVLLPIEIHVTLFGLQATHKPTLLLPQSSHYRQTSTGAVMIFIITNSNKGTGAHRDKCDTLWASGDAQTHTLASAELPHCSIAAR